MSLVACGIFFNFTVTVTLISYWSRDIRARSSRQHECTSDCNLIENIEIDFSLSLSLFQKEERTCYILQWSPSLSDHSQRAVENRLDANYGNLILVADREV